jgi:hypothetical protein
VCFGDAVWRGAVLGCLLLAAPGLAAQCLQATAQDFALEDSTVSEVAPRLTWHATIVNECDQPFDADLTIDFLDRDGKSLYQVRDLVTVPLRGEVQAGKELHLPSTHADELDSMRIRIEERARPF